MIGYQEELEDTQVVIRNRIRKSKKDRQHNGQKERGQRTNNDLHTHKTKDKVTRTALKTGSELMCIFSYILLLTNF